MTGFTAVGTDCIDKSVVYMYEAQNIALMTPEKWLLLDFLEIEVNCCADSHITFGFVVVIWHLLSLFFFDTICIYWISSISSSSLHTVSPRIACIFVQKIHHAIRNRTIWIYTMTRAKNRAIVRNRTNFTLTSNILGPRCLNPCYSRTPCTVPPQIAQFFRFLEHYELLQTGCSSNKNVARPIDGGTFSAMLAKIGPNAKIIWWDDGIMWQS